MEVTVLCIADCPNVGLAEERIRAAAKRRGLHAEVTIRVVGADDDPTALGFTGSPTILIRGENPFDGAPTADLACRRYETDAGWEGAPSVEQIESALSDRA